MGCLPRALRTCATAQRNGFVSRQDHDSTTRKSSLSTSLARRSTLASAWASLPAASSLAPSLASSSAT